MFKIFFLLSVIFFSPIILPKGKSSDSLCIKKKNAMACKEFGIKTKIPSYLEKACDLNLGSGCMEFALRLFKEKKIEQGEIALKKGCKLNDGDSCSYLGALFHKKGEQENARLLYSKACQLKSGKGCYNLAILNEMNSEESEALVHYQKACNHDIAQGCVNYAFFIEKNKGDPKQILTFYKKACDLKSQLGCQALDQLNK